MRVLLALFVAALLVPTVAASQTPPAAFAKDPPQVLDLIRKASEQIKGQAIYDCINEVTTSGATGYRLMGSPNRDLFVQRYAKVFSSISPRIKDQVVTFAQGAYPAGVGPAAPTGKNIIGVLPGKDLTKWVVIGGHYDTQAPTMGAIDNTSGICVVKEIAKAAIAIDLQPEVTLVFAWWDGEEWGLYGSRSFVKDHSKTAELLGVDPAKVKMLVGQSFDIVGINYPALNTWVAYGAKDKVVDEYAILNLRQSPTNENGAMLGEYKRLMGRDDKDQILLNNSKYEGLVKEVSHKFLGFPEKWVNVHQDNYGRSDHQPFIGAGIPGTRIQGSHDYDEWPHYHLPTDTLPAAIAMAGGQDKLVAGFDAAAEAGGLTALYVGLTGGYGSYGNVTDPSANTTDQAKPASDALDTPSLTPIMVLAALGLGLVWRRRR
jgi:hypothetical protein